MEEEGTAPLGRQCSVPGQGHTHRDCEFRGRTWVASWTGHGSSLSLGRIIVNGAARGPDPGGYSGGCMQSPAQLRGSLLGRETQDPVGGCSVSTLTCEASTGGARGGSRLGSDRFGFGWPFLVAQLGDVTFPSERVSAGQKQSLSEPRPTCGLPPPLIRGVAGEPCWNPALSAVQPCGWTHPLCALVSPPVKWGEHSFSFISQSPLKESPLSSPVAPTFSGDRPQP